MQASRPPYQKRDATAPILGLTGQVREVAVAGLRPNTLSSPAIESLRRIST